MTYPLLLNQLLLDFSNPPHLNQLRRLVNESNTLTKTFTHQNDHFYIQLSTPKLLHLSYITLMKLTAATLH